MVKTLLAKPACLDRLKSTILSKAYILSKDPFGNYVLQFMVSTQSGDPGHFFSDNFLPTKFVDLCLDKFSSNVVDAIIQKSSEVQLKSLLSHLSTVSADDQRELLTSQFANFPV